MLRLTLSEPFCFIPRPAPHGIAQGMGFHADVHLGPGPRTSHPGALTYRCRSPRSFPGLPGPTPRGPVLLPGLICQSKGPGLSNGRCR